MYPIFYNFASSNTSLDKRSIPITYQTNDQYKHIKKRKYSFTNCIFFVTDKIYFYYVCLTSYLR